MAITWASVTSGSDITSGTTATTASVTPSTNKLQPLLLPPESSPPSHQSDSEEIMEENKAEAQPAVLRMTIGITRKATGITETYELVSDPMPLEEAKQLAQPKEDS